MPIVNRSPTTPTHSRGKLLNEIPETRYSLIARLTSEEDERAWQEFVELYEPLIFRLATSRGLQPADAQDVVQEALTRIARSIGEWTPDRNRGTLRGWIATIARNLTIDFLRKQNRLPRTSDDSALRRKVEQAAAEDTESELFRREYERQAFAWVAGRVRQQCDPKTWQAFWMSTVDRVSVRVTAETLGMSTGAVYIARSRVMARIRKMVEALTREDFCSLDESNPT